MNEIISHNGKVYEIYKSSSRIAMSTVGIYTFRYYPQDHIIINDDLTVEAYHCQQVYDHMPDGFMHNFVAEDYWDAYANMYAEIDRGAKKAFLTFRLRNSDSICKVTMAPTKYDADGNLEMATGIIENVSEMIQKEFDNQKRVEEKNLDLQTALENQQRVSRDLEQLLSEEREQNAIIQALGSVFFSIHQLDLVNDTFQEMTTAAKIRKGLGVKGNARKALMDMVEKFVLPESQDEMRVFNELTTMAERIGDKKMISTAYYGRTFGWARAVIIPTERDEKGTPIKVLYCGRSIKYEKETLDEKNNMINALASSYQDVYMINLNTGKVSAYRMSQFVTEKYGKIISTGNYTENLRLYVEQDVVEEDRPLFDKISTTEKVRKLLEENNKFSFLHQVKIGDEIRYYQCKLVRPSVGRDEFVMSFANVTEEQNTQISVRHALEESYRAAKIANNAKTEFLANMSHDIRTPLNGIIGMTAIAGAHIEDTERIKDCLQKITTASKHLLTLINEVLDMSKIESGKIDMSDEPFNLSDLMENLLAMLRPQVDAHHHELTVNINHLEHENVIGDSLRIQQLLTNLMSNAVKYTPDGGQIRLSLEEKPAKEKNVGYYALVLEDNGIGMSEDFLKKIFEPFSRAEDERIKTVQGTGLGMAISRNIVNMMGGDIHIDSTLHQGTKVTVHFFLKLQDTTPVCDEDFLGLSVLVADDDPLSVESTCYMLENLGMRAEGVSSGEAALAHIVEHDALRETYYAVILDWKMPGMDGITTTREIRSAIGETIPIIILSAYDWTDIEQEARQAGANAFLSKPLFQSKLAHLFHQLMGKEQQQTDPVPLKSIEALDLSGYHALLVEDNELNAEIATEILRTTGIEVTLAKDGVEAVDRMRASKEKYFDIVFMDIKMPKMNGYSAARAIRNLGREDCKQVPIIAMTANAFAEDVQEAISAGMNEHIAKPLDLEVLAAVLQRWLPK